MIRRFENGSAIRRSDLSCASWDEARSILVEECAAGGRIAACLGVPKGEDTDLYIVVARGDRGDLGVVRTRLGPVEPSLTPDLPAVHMFERELAEDFGIEFEGHPWMKPVRFNAPWRGGERPDPAVADFFRVEGDEVHEVAVGPVHAGIIEPGHFRFQCHGERVFHLEIALGYQHRGIERALIGGPDLRTIAFMETAAGDSSVAHAMAHAQLAEGLSGRPVPARADAIRAVALELERLANHVGDLGALAGDVAFLPTASYCGRIRGDYLNMTARICGNRLGRSLVRPGGVSFEIDEDLAGRLLEILEPVAGDTESALELLFTTPSVVARFEETGEVKAADAVAAGLVGPPARATGLERDARYEFPAGHYRFVQIPVSTWTEGDVFGRAYVRRLEVQRSIAFVREQLANLPAGAIRGPVHAPRPDLFAATLVEGWRGEVCHAALTDERGRFERYKIVDPSFHNWFGLALALRDQQISDFPLCNKSFNLSYCGFDL